MDNITQQLINKISQKSVVIFVGAGLSLQAGLPNWNSLVEKILDGISAKEPKSEKIKAALNDDVLTPLEVLTKISHFREDAIEILEKEIRKFDGSNPTPIHNKLCKLSKHIITTNYDELLEKALPNFEKICYSNEFKVAHLSQYPEYIFKIHGDIHEPNKCILFPTEYEELYSTEEKSSIFELKKIISDKSILFIGFSLTDPYINFILDYISNLYSGFSPDHYIITTSKEKIWPKKINPIIIENYNEQEKLIDEIINGLHDKIEDEVNFKEQLELESKSNIISYSENLDYDSPPNNKFWVGRTKEIENISNENFKVIFITGIGGQGKSGLAAQFIHNYFNNNLYEFADWRDFKEEGNRFSTKIISIIKRLNPESDKINFDKLSNEELIDTFFHFLNERRIVFVFDNIDNYIDLETFKPTGSFGYFFNQILNKSHQSKFIFTCRPFIREASVDFYQISLNGITPEETFDLFKLYKIPIGDDVLQNLVSRSHKVTKGHPLWLNLIAGQAIRGIDIVTVFMDQIENKSNFNEDDFSSILSEKILNEVWKSINDKQKNLIRGIAETVKPETEEILKTILDSELNSNQFGRALRTLKNLNLIETLSDGEIELHPLVKEFVLTKYPKTERAKFITLFVKYYDRFIYILKPNLNSKLSIQEFQNWTSKIELQINKNDFKAALVALEEVSYSILSAGYIEEYIRVTERLFYSINWEQAVSQEIPYFHSQFNRYCTALTQMGEFESCKKNLDKYSTLIAGKSSYYLSYCSEKTYTLWYQKDFENAIQIGEEGVFLLDESGVADNYSLKHNLALAHRDSKDIININKALNYFLHNENLETLLLNKDLNTDLGGSYYGNVGRCLEYLNRNEEALECYYISLKLLLLEDYINSVLNIGYACMWIGNLLTKENKNKDALYFLKFAQNSWKKTSVPLAKEVDVLWSNVIADKETKEYINKLSEWKIKNYCSSFINDKLI
ncbi:SIR2 family protein [Flavobacterium aquatile]|uniref:NB-ARC domain-containing protein n=1 Tax=Flavobacterium aquatile LMG 4008 = ATCC 11947 TaxID=1453498 RepID=A0A095STV6_9FLAO|nr:SIR2 family protein [Flavobacterium aquatile]KGD67804.1 hypothetical protein LG45_11840 [Flavobacterium aquatile LMG 4008 = ATCC 11947]OXA67663.1 hypothetical protein B0A61_07575 [Flavobacterium aquatile LMG 4008 = ATCC 11947]GEC78301.1 hypothetical protein FAQ01_11710 [Flavobacterium aquatile]